jgi:hypothetical protein
MFSTGIFPETKGFKPMPLVNPFGPFHGSFKINGKVFLPGRFEDPVSPLEQRAIPFSLEEM